MALSARDVEARRPVRKQREQQARAPGQRQGPHHLRVAAAAGGEQAGAAVDVSHVQMVGPCGGDQRPSDFHMAFGGGDVESGGAVHV